MRLLFAHDHRFLRGPAGELYTPGHLPASTWERFLEHFEEVQVIARDGGPLPEGVRLGRSDHPAVAFDFLPNLSSLRRLVFRSPGIEERMRSAVQSADAVVARLPSEIGLLALKYARRLGKPYAVEVVGCAWEGTRTSGAAGARLYAPLAWSRARKAIGQAPLALYVTSSWLQGRYPTRGEAGFASNVTLEPLTAAASAHRKARLAALAKGTPPVLGTIATLRVKYKGIQTAFEALARLRSSGIDLTYRILGPGDQQPWKQLASDHGVGDLVHFDGTRRAGPEVCAWLDDVYIYLQPSLTEGLPRAMIEAMSRGAACIGSTRGGIPELLPPTRLHEPGDVAGLTQLIRSLAGDPAATAAASEADLETARQFDPEALKKRRAEIYGRLKAQAERRAHPR
jgi:glycosyltransferase involved in cell wall biosynthesis